MSITWNGNKYVEEDLNRMLSYVDLENINSKEDLKRELKKEKVINKGHSPEKANKLSALLYFHGVTSKQIVPEQKRKYDGFRKQRLLNLGIKETYVKIKGKSFRRFRNILNGRFAKNPDK